MRFATFALAQAEGAILAHSLATPDGVLKKGRRLSARDVALLARAGHASVIAARLEPGDVAEDEAAHRIARALAGAGVRVTEPFTGRANLHATAAGLAAIARDVIDRLNSVDEGLTVATLAPFERIAAGEMVATVKVIPFALPEAVVAQAERVAGAAAVSVAAFAAHTAGLVLTRLPGTKESVLKKRERVMADRLAALGSRMARSEIVAHTESAISQAVVRMKNEGLSPIIVFAASAIVDRGDVVPAGVVAAGGEVVHLGMPVDPGNLMMLGRVGEADVIGAPSCAGSPKLNGFDWVLERRLAGLAVGAREIAGMGVGGLLKEIASRPQPRAGASAMDNDGGRREPRVAVVVLAAGRSTRMGSNKLLEPVGGVPMVRLAVEAALASRARPVHVVTGHQADAVAAALAGLPVTLVPNADFASGLASSLKAGIASLAGTTCDAAVVMLGDMPRVEGRHVDRLIAAFAPKEGRSIVVPVKAGKRGNPVLWGAELFGEMLEVAGDTGARHLIGQHADSVAEVDLDTDAIFLDVDTPEALARVRGE